MAAAVKAVANSTGATYSSLPAGQYTVVATRNSTKCSSAPVTVTITTTAPPVVATTLVAPQTSCDPNQSNGAASAAVGGVTAGYTFEWFKGQNTLLANRISTTSAATGLKSGTPYTVKATSVATGCSDTEEITIPFAVVTPTIALASSSHSTQCVPANGSITVSVSPGTPADYTFSWYNGNGVKVTPDFSDTDETLSGLPAGTYTVKGIFNTRHCETAPLTITINDNSPKITFNPTNMIRPSDCNDNHGEITVAVSAPGNITGFDFEWRLGQEPFSAPALTTVSHTANTSTATSLTTGIYTLIATNRQTGCSASEIFSLPFDDAQVLTFQSKLNVDNCVPG